MRRFIGIGLELLRILRDYSARAVAMEGDLRWLGRRRTRAAVMGRINWDNWPAMSSGFSGRLGSAARP